MAKITALFVLCLVLFASTINASSNFMDTFLVVGKVYCDTCRCGFETSASKYLPGSRVRIECKKRNTNDLSYTVEGVTNSKGEYKILVNSDRSDEFCDVVLIRSSDPTCADPNTGRDRARIVLTRNNGMVSNTRFANSMGFLSNEPLASCTKILQQQATMFNDASSNSDVLVASDAIGMGLNLNISRIIFSTLQKFDGVEMRDLTVPEIKQIAGRAGRYKSNFPVGEVTCLEADDLQLLHSSLDHPSPVLERAGLFPNFDLLYMYSRLHPKHGIHEILEHFMDNAKLSEHYFIANCDELLKVAAIIDTLPLSLHDKYLFCISPVDMDDDISSQGLTQFATNYSKNGLVRLREIFTPGTLKVPKSHTALKELESIHKVLDLYVWLSYRLEESFPDRELASSQKAICSMLIEEFLERFGWQRPRTKKLTQNSRLISLISQETRQKF